MSSLGGHGEFQAQVPLLGQTHQGHRGLHPRDHVLGEGQTLVQHRLQTRPRLLQPPGDPLRPCSPRLFIVTEGNEDGPTRLEPLGQETVHRLQDSYDPDLDVQRTAPPDVSVGDGSREGRMLPVVQGPRVHRYHVLVGQEQHRLQRGVPTPPLEEQATPVKGLRPEPFPDPRVCGLQIAVKVLEGLALELRSGDGAEPDGRGQPAENGVLVEIEGRDRRHLHLPRGIDRGLHQDHGRQSEDDDQDGRGKNPGSWKGTGGSRHRDRGLYPSLPISCTISRNGRAEDGRPI